MKVYNVNKFQFDLQLLKYLTSKAFIFKINAIEVLEMQIPGPDSWRACGLMGGDKGIATI